MKITVYTLNAFAKSSGGGNHAGVVFDADALTDSEMKAIAAKVGFSETAFTAYSEKADLKVRFFTPAAEVDLCGHATIALYSLMHDKSILQSGLYTLETKAGILPVEIQSDGTVFLTQTKPHFYEEVNKAAVADSLNIPIDFLMDNYPLQIVSTGLRDIMIPVKSLDQLLSIKPDFGKVTAVSRRYDAIGYHIFTLETKYAATAHCRNLAPLYEIDEEAATGTSNGALSCYLFHHGLINDADLSHLVFEQGYSMARPSEILAGIKVDGKEIVEVKVGGRARDTDKIEIEI